MKNPCITTSLSGDSFGSRLVRCNIAEDVSYHVRRGFALLLVLLMVVLVIPVAAGLAVSSATRHLERSHQADFDAADQLRSAAEDGPIQDFLNGGTAHPTRGGNATVQSHPLSATSVVLPVDVSQPAVDIMDDAWTLDDVRYNVQICAWDECGMVPLQLAQMRGSPLRNGLPGSILTQLDSVAASSFVAPKTGSDRTKQDLYDSQAGLDLWCSALLNESSKSPEQAHLILSSPFPRIFVGRSRGNSSGSSSVPANGDTDALGALVATHPLLDGQGSAGHPCINVNTAPVKLLEQALLVAGRTSELDGILDARRQGRHAVIHHQNRSSVNGTDESERSEDPTSITLVSSSESWAFRIDVTVDRVTRSWWVIYQKKGENSRKDTRNSSFARNKTNSMMKQVLIKPLSQWKCVQRLVIPL